MARGCQRIDKPPNESAWQGEMGRLLQGRAATLVEVKRQISDHPVLLIVAKFAGPHLLAHGCMCVDETLGHGTCEGGEGRLLKLC